MPSAKSSRKPRTLLLAEEDVIVRLGLATYLRECGFVVIEAASAVEARAVLMAGPKIDILYADAQLAGPESGFALAQWVRRHRPSVRVILTATLMNKAEAAADLCSRRDAVWLKDHIASMIAERTRRERKPSSSESAPRRRAPKRLIADG